MCRECLEGVFCNIPPSPTFVLSHVPKLYFEFWIQEVKYTFRSTVYHLFPKAPLVINFNSSLSFLWFSCSRKLGETGLWYCKICKWAENSWKSRRFLKILWILYGAPSLSILWLPDSISYELYGTYTFSSIDFNFSLISFLLLRR